MASAATVQGLSSESCGSRIVVAESDSGFARFAQRELPTLPHSEKISLVYGDIDQTLQVLSAQNDGERFHMILLDGHPSDYGEIIDRIMERGFLAPGGLLAVTHSVGAGGFSNSEECAIPWPGQMSDQESLEVAAALHERLARVALPIQRGLTLVRRRIVGEDVPQELLAQQATAFPAMPQPRTYADAVAGNARKLADAPPRLGRPLALRHGPRRRAWR